MSIIDDITVGTTPKNQHDYILIDRSGSMASKWDDTLGGVNSYVRSLAADPATKDILVTVALFDTHDNKTAFDVVRRSCAANHWEDLRATEASPRGWTPLYDAVGRIVALALEDNPEKSAMVIVTDGMENRSEEHTQASAKALLDLCRKKKWQVLFLGADFENAKQAESVGTMSAQTMSYSTRNTTGVFKGTARYRSVYASGASASMDFSDKDRAAAKK